MPTRVQRDREEFCSLVHRAREEWQLATDYFDWVTEPGLIDYAIYWALAAQSRYLHLLKIAKENGVVLSWGEVCHYSLMGKRDSIHHTD